MILDSLRAIGKYEVLTAKDGEDGLQVVREKGELIDLVITDCNHPKIDGITMSKIIKEEYPDIPIVMLTGYYSAVKLRVPEGIFFKVHPKPIRIKELEEIIKAAIKSNPYRK